MRRWALGAGAAGLALVAIAVVLCAMDGDFGKLIGSVAYSTFALVGMVITRHRPRNAVAWCYLISTVLLGLEAVGEKAAVVGTRRHWSPTLTHAGAWASAWTWFPGLFLVITVAVLRFPDGRLLSRRWRWVEVPAIAAMVVWAIGLGVVAAFLPTRELLSSATPDPHGWQRIVFFVAESMFGVIAICAIAALASLVVRFRRGSSVERQQTRWVLSAVGVAILIEIGLDLYGTVLGSTPDWVQSVGEGVGFALIAFAVGVAITRYRLYEIDRIVSRTVTYVLVLAVLAGVYLGVIVALAALVPDRYGQVGVAGATLAVSILAVPLTRRVRGVVNRRFDRARFDAEQVAMSFATRLRARPELDDVPADLLDVVQRTVAPAHAGVWLMPTGR